jgi:uncharacterized protein YeaO (DUF488 family)
MIRTPGAPAYRAGVGPAKPRIEIARVYDDIPAGGAMRVLVDRLWPRGVAKASAPIDEWCKQIAPSPPLRKWYGHDSAKFAEFGERYRAELRAAAAKPLLDELRRAASAEGLILLTAVRDVAESSAAVLREVLLG